MNQNYQFWFKFFWCRNNYSRVLNISLRTIRLHRLADNLMHYFPDQLA